ncbi:isoprenoid synthase domain-containing protein [Fomitopsis betulina]|nr:isoprenoid synthase domain-containing protein [Fomitopsis betulina]
MHTPHVVLRPHLPFCLAIATSAVREMADIIIDAIHNPDKPRPEGEVLLGELARQFWAWGMQTCTVTARKHLEEAFTDYLNSVHDQALDRDTNNLRTVENYFRTRRENTGARPSYIPAVMEIDVPDEAFYHPGVVKLSYLSTDLILLDNFGYTLDEALKWTANRHEEVQARFLDGMKRLPSFGPDVDPRLQQYIQAIATGPRANDCWNFESGRYFGSKGLEIQILYMSTGHTT